MSAWERLVLKLYEDQREQLAELLLAQLENGWGVLEIEVKDHHIKEFRQVRRTPAKKILPLMERDVNTM